jgi:hypothetical protein
MSTACLYRDSCSLLYIVDEIGRSKLIFAGPRVRERYVSSPIETE